MSFVTLVYRLMKQKGTRWTDFQCSDCKSLAEYNLQYIQDYYTWLAMVSEKMKVCTKRREDDFR